MEMALTIGFSRVPLPLFVARFVVVYFKINVLHAGYHIRNTETGVLPVEPHGFG
jgi:hypothetical protein